MFNLIKIKDKYHFVAKIYHKKVNPKAVAIFSNKINHIRILRNNINHYEPIIPFISNLNTMNEQNRLILIIKLLKRNYYSIIRENTKTLKPALNITVNKYNVHAISYLKKIIKIV